MKALLLGLLALLCSNLAMGQTLYTFNGGGTTGSWTDPTIWTTDPTGSTSINSRLPAAGDNVVVTNSFVVSVSSAVTTTGLSITIQKGGILDLTTATFTNTLTSLAGQGTLRIGTPYFPAVTTNNFANANAGTVEFYNWPAGPTVLPTGQYNNLRLLNTTTTAYVVQLDNDLTLNGSLTLTRTNTTATAPLVSFNLGKAATARNLTVLGDITIGTGTLLGVSAVTLPKAGSPTTQTFHTINASGNFTNNGTVNLHNGTADDTQVAVLNFTGTANTNFACNGATDLDILQVNKGVDSQVLLNVTSTVNVSGTAQGNLRLNHVTTGVDLLVLVNGIAKFGNNIYLQKISNVTAVGSGTGFSLGSSNTNPTLWIAGATVINDNDNAFIIYGTYHISAGKLSSMNPDAMVVRETGQVLIEGGTTSVNKFRPSSTSSSHRGSFTMTGGTFESLGTVAFTVNDNFARFAVPYISQSFRMSGGTLRVQNPASTDGSFQNGLFHVGVDPNNATVTGGTIEILLPNSAVNGNILTTSPLWNLTIKKLTSGGASKAVLANVAVPSSYTPGATTTAQPITVLNNFTLDATNPTTFDAANLDVNIQGSLIINSGCTYLPGTNTTTFSGGQNQLLTNNGTIGATAGVGTFNNWTMNKSAGTLTLGGSVTTYATPAAATLSLLSGVLNDGGKTINVAGGLVNSATHTSGGGQGSITLTGTALQTVTGNGTGVFGNLNIGNSTTPTAVQLTANMSVANYLTFLNDAVLAIGANRLSLTNVDPNALSTNTTFSKTCMVQTAGNQSDLGLQKTYGGADTFIYAVGVGTRYMPASVQLSTAVALSKYGQVSVSPTNTRNPFTTSSNALPYYWKIRSIGFGPLPTGSINLRFTMNNADATGTYSNYIPGRYNPVVWTTNTSNSISFGSSATANSTILFRSNDQFDGEFTAGESAAFGLITAFYSRANGTWLTNTTWSTASNTGSAVPTSTTPKAGVNFPGPGNPVFIGSASTGVYHTVTVAANSANSGSLVIDRGSTLDVGTTTGHNFGALPDSKVGGAGRLRVSATGTTPLTATFPGGDFGSFIQYGGGTVEYYTSGTSFTVPTASGSLTLNQYRNLWLNAASGQTVTLPTQDLRIYAQLKTGVANTVGTTTTTFPGTVFVSSGTAGNLRADSLLAVQAGVFRLQGTTARTLSFDTDVQVASGATFDVLNNAAQTHAITVGGSLINNGTVDFKVGTGLVSLTFTGSQNSFLTSASSGTNIFTDLSTLTVNKGVGRTAILNLDGAGTLTTPTNTWLTLTNGTLRFAKPNGTLTIHDQASPYLIPANAGLMVDAAGATVTVATSTTAYTNATTAYSANSDLKLAGQLSVLQGALNIGTAAGLGNDLEYASAGAPGLNVTTGKLYVNGQIRRTVANLDGSLRFDQSGGTIDVDGQGATAAQSNERGLFEVQGTGSIFRMSAGSLNLHRSNHLRRSYQKFPVLTADLYLSPDSTVVTGGMVVLGNTAAGVGNDTISVNSTVPLYDMQVASGANNTNANTGLLTGVIPLTLNGSLTIGNDNSFFNANSLGLNIYQNLTNNNTSASTALNAGGFQPITTTQTTTFLGGVATQQLTGTASNLTVFGGLTVNNPQTTGTVQLGGNALTAGTLTLTKGTLDDNGKTITALGDVLNSTAHLSGGSGTGSLILAGTVNQNIGGNGKGRFGNVNLNNAVGATTTASQEITKVLTLTNGVLTIGSNLLNLSNSAAGAVTGFGTTRFIRTNGIVADLGVRKSYLSGATNFTFPLGSAAKYAPVVMNVSANSAAGTLTVQPIDLAHPSTTDPTTGTPNKISFYWKVSSTLSAPTVDMQYTYSSGDVMGTEATYKLGRFYNGTWTPTGGITASTGNATNHTLSVTGFTGTGGSIDGDYTGGDATEFATVLTYYSRTATAGQTAGAVWTNANAWTYNADGTDSTPLPLTYPKLSNPVTILSGHLVTTGSASQAAASLKLLGTLDLGTYGANNFSTITGTGTLRIGSALFPAGNYTPFLAANGGTVDYSGAVQLPARDTYNNLTFSGGNGKKLSNLDLTINGALTVAANTTVDNPTSQNISLNSATSGATVNGTFNLNDGALTTGAFLTTNSGGTLTLGAGAVNIGTSLTNGGTLNNGTGNVAVGTAFSNSGTYNANVNSGTLTVGTTFANSGTYTAGTGTLLVNSDFNNTASSTFTASSGDVNVLGNLSNAGTYTAPDPSNKSYLRVTGDFTNLAAGYFMPASSTVILHGNFTNSGNFDANTGTSLVVFTTDNNQTLTGNTTFYDLQKAGANNLTLGTSTNVIVSDLLTMQNGLIYTGTSNTLSLTNTAVQPIVGASTTSYVAGRLAMTLPNAAASIRVFPVGLGGRYRPITITPQAASTTPVVLAEIFNSAPTGPLDATLSNMSSNRYYRIQLQSGTLAASTIQLSYNTDVVDEQVYVPGNLRVAQASSPTGSWSTAGGAGVFSPASPRGYTTSAASQTTINNTSFFALASTNKVDNPLTPAPLPVKLLQFAAARQGSAVRVSWATASEQNSAYFVVQRSADGHTFADVQRVAAQGTTTSHHDYAALDTQPLSGLSYYRLHQVDSNGQDDYSPVVAVRFEGVQAAAPTLVAYPNPATKQGFQLLTTDLGTAGGTVRIFDNVGRLVLTHVATAAEATIQPSQPLASGMYFVTWQTADGLKLTTKVAVE